MSRQHRTIHVTFAILLMAVSMAVFIGAARYAAKPIAIPFTGALLVVFFSGYWLIWALRQRCLSEPSLVDERLSPGGVKDSMVGATGIEPVTPPV